MHVAAEPRKGETLSAALLRVRGEIGAAKGELAMVLAAPPPMNEIRQQVRDLVGKLAHEGKPRISVEGGKVEIMLPDVTQFAGAGQVFSAPSGSASRLWAAINPDGFYDWIMSTVGAVEGGISAEKRASREAELKARIRALEHEEESLVTAALDSGIEVHRRWDASPLAMLGVTDEPLGALAVAAE